MTAKPQITIVGAGNFGTALALALRKAGYRIESVLSRSTSRAKTLAKQTGARILRSPDELRADVVWFCVPDSEIERSARSFAAISWKGRVALHSSGALSSDALGVLRKKSAGVASAHPLMTFVRGSKPLLTGVPFAIEGDSRAVRTARRIVADLGGLAYPIRKEDKVAYHAWGTFASPLLTSLLTTTEHVAGLAGVRSKSAKKRMLPILLRTLVNYAAYDAGNAFSGPIIRGDVETVRSHLRVLRKDPVAKNVYVALAHAALEYLPAKNKKALRRALDSTQT